MADTKIEWADKVWNPVVGCTKCSPGCANCYAERFAYRLACMELKELERILEGENRPDRIIKYSPVVSMKTKKWTGEIQCVPSELDIPLHWRKPRRIFVCSMSDLFHEKVPFEFIGKVILVADKCPQHTFQLLTKRTTRAAEFCVENKLPVYTGMNTLPKNVHFGVSISTQAEADEIIPIHLQVPAAVHFVSLEPMLEPIKFDEKALKYQTYLSEINARIYKCPRCGRRADESMYYKKCICLDGVIVGAESGPGARYCPIENIRGIVEQCKTAGVPVFVKQIHLDGKAKAIKDIKQFPEDLRIRELPDG